MSDQIVSLQSALDCFYRDAQTKWWPQVPEPPASAQEWVIALCPKLVVLIFVHTRVLAFAKSLSINPVSGGLVNVISDLSEHIIFDTRKLQEATHDLATQHRELMYLTDDWEDGEVSFHVPRKIALLSQPPMDDYDLNLTHCFLTSQ